MRFIAMYITAACVLFLIKLRWPKKKSIYDFFFFFFLCGVCLENVENHDNAIKHALTCQLSSQRYSALYF